MSKPKETQAEPAQPGATQSKPEQAEPQATEPKKTQAEPTRPRPIDDAGRELDEFGLPLSGPARAAKLARLKKPDPRDNPEAWGAAPPAAAPADKPAE